MHHTVYCTQFVKTHSIQSIQGRSRNEIPSIPLRGGEQVRAFKGQDGGFRGPQQNRQGLQCPCTPRFATIHDPLQIIDIYERDDHGDAGQNSLQGVSKSDSTKSRSQVGDPSHLLCRLRDQVLISIQRSPWDGPIILERNGHPFPCCHTIARASVVCRVGSLICGLRIHFWRTHCCTLSRLVERLGET